MGAWSTKIFDNDFTMDIITEYKILLGYGISPEETYEKIYGYFAKDFIGKDNEDDFWLGIALYQWKNGILIDEVRENALRCMDDGQYLERWKESGEKVYQKRKKVLEEFKDKLLHEVNPRKKKFPKCPAYYREKTDWKVGDLIAYKMTQKPYEGKYNDDDANKVSMTKRKLRNEYFLLRVIDIEKRPVSHICPDLDFASEALVMLYDWHGKDVPSPDLVGSLDFIPFVMGVEEKILDKSGKFLEVPFCVQKLGSAVMLSKEQGGAEVCETIVLENDIKFIHSFPRLWLEHPYYRRHCPSQLNYTLAQTYTGFDYKKEFYFFTDRQ